MLTENSLQAVIQCQSLNQEPLVPESEVNMTVIPKLHKEKRIQYLKFYNTFLRCIVHKSDDTLLIRTALVN